MATVLSRRQAYLLFNCLMMCMNYEKYIAYLITNGNSLSTPASNMRRLLKCLQRDIVGVVSMLFSKRRKRPYYRVAAAKWSE